MVLGIKPEAIEEYKRYHAAVWPEILNKITECNIRNYSIFLKDNLLFAYMEYHGDNKEADLGQDGGRSQNTGMVAHHGADAVSPCYQEAGRMVGPDGPGVSSRLIKKDNRTLMNRRSFNSLFKPAPRLLTRSKASRKNLPAPRSGIINPLGTLSKDTLSRSGSRMRNWASSFTGVSIPCLLGRPQPAN